jgi:hypothetical protein
MLLRFAMDKRRLLWQLYPSYLLILEQECNALFGRLLPSGLRFIG